MNFYLQKERFFVDSFLLYIPVGLVSFGSVPRFVHSVDSDSGEILNSKFEFKYETIDSVLYCINKRSIFGKDYYTFIINSKQLGKDYFVGIDSENNLFRILENYQHFFDLKILSKNIDDFLFLDVDVTCDFSPEITDSLSNYLLETARKKTNTYRKFYTDEPGEKVLTGFQFSNRFNNDSSVFFKFYRKDLEFNNSKFAILNFLSARRYFRCEITVRGSVNKKYLRISKNSDFFSQNQLYYIFERVFNYHGFLGSPEPILEIGYYKYFNTLSYDKRVIVNFFLEKMVNENKSFVEIYEQQKINGSDSSISRYRNNLKEILIKVCKKQKLNLVYLKKDFYISK